MTYRLSPPYYQTIENLYRFKSLLRQEPCIKFLIEICLEPCFYLQLRIFYLKLLSLFFEPQVFKQSKSVKPVMRKGQWFSNGKILQIQREM